MKGNLEDAQLVDLPGGVEWLPVIWAALWTLFEFILFEKSSI